MIFHTFGPLALKKERGVAGQPSGARVDARISFTANFIKRACFGLRVVVNAVRPELLVFLEAMKIDVADCSQIAGVLVVIDLVRLDQHGRAFDLGLAPQLPQAAVGFLSDGAHVVVPPGRRARPGSQHALVRPHSLNLSPYFGA